MTEAVDPYPYASAYASRHILNAVQSPAREHVIEAALQNSCQELANWPPDLEGPSGQTVQDAVRELEQGPGSIEEKDATIVGMMAVALELEFTDDVMIDRWRIAPQLSMLNAIGSAMAAGLILPEESLRRATVFHQEHSKYDLTREGDDPYASPDIEPVVTDILDSMHQYGSVLKHDGVEAYISLFIDCVGESVYRATPGSEFIEACSDYPEYRPMLDAYDHLLTEILRTRQSLIDREGELSSYWDELRAGFNGRQDRKNNEAEGQDSEALRGVKARATETVSLSPRQQIL
jgi:hypothetical protein